MNLSLLGEKNGGAKLDAKKVRAMRAAWIPKGPGRKKIVGPSIKQLAAEHGVSYYAAWSVLNGYTWGHVA
jgi:hypothetical protein